MSKEVVQELLRTNISLEKKVIELLSSVNQLTKKMDELVDVFSKAAQHIERGDVKEPLASKLTELLEQNKKIARGLLLLEKYVKDKSAFSSPLYNEEKPEF
ncbi:hypothetical protein HYX16_05170 [Candidatus Woesearchaeota archaeon]|nr:hypothetical protein [Candidatus Woesearchaeota archaeon]